jgi:hypothetical protein
VNTFITKIKNAPIKQDDSFMFRSIATPDFLGKESFSGKYNNIDVVNSFITKYSGLQKSLNLVNEEREHIVKGIDACMAACRVKTYMSKRNLVRGNASLFGYSHWTDQLQKHLVKFKEGDKTTIEHFCGYYEHISEDVNIREFLDPIVSEDSILITIGILNTKQETASYTPLVKYFDGGMSDLGNIKELEKTIFKDTTGDKVTTGDIDKDKVSNLVNVLNVLKTNLSMFNKRKTDETMMYPLIESIDQLIDGSQSWINGVPTAENKESYKIYNGSELYNSVNDFKENIRMYNETSHIGFLRSFESIARILKDYEFATPTLPKLGKNDEAAPDSVDAEWRRYYNTEYKAARQRGGGKVGEKSGKIMRITRPKRAYKKESSTTAWVKQPTKVEKIVRTKRRRTRVYRATKKQEV